MTIKHLTIVLLAVYTTTIIALNVPTTKTTKPNIVAHKEALSKNTVRPLSNCPQVGINYLVKSILDHILGKN